MDCFMEPRNSAARMIAERFSRSRPQERFRRYSVSMQPTVTCLAPWFKALTTPFTARPRMADRAGSAPFSRLLLWGRLLPFTAWFWKTLDRIRWQGWYLERMAIFTAVQVTAVAMVLDRFSKRPPPAAFRHSGISAGTVMARTPSQLWCSGAITISTGLPRSVGRVAAER